MADKRARLYTASKSGFLLQTDDKKMKSPTNLTHFTVHDFNEALFSAIREFSSYVNFAQVEHATYSFLMDRLIEEQRGPRDQGSEMQPSAGKMAYPINGSGSKNFFYARDIFVNLLSDTKFIQQNQQIDRDADVYQC